MNGLLAGRTSVSIYTSSSKWNESDGDFGKGPTTYCPILLSVLGKSECYCDIACTTRLCGDQGTLDALCKDEGGWVPGRRWQ